MRHTLIFFFLLCGFANLAQSYGYYLEPKAETKVILKSNFSLEYDEQHEQARWVFYTLEPQFYIGDARRKSSFRMDDSVSTVTAGNNDYYKSGYDRGHLIPANCMSFSQKGMDETFYYSNISPQFPAFNRGIWKSLESRVMDWTGAESRLYVVTGPIFIDNLGTIGPNEVTVPGYFYKVIYDPTGDEKMIAFLIPNAKCDEDLIAYIVTVDDIEALTGIDFFFRLDDEKEERLESERYNWRF